MARLRNIDTLFGDTPADFTQYVCDEAYTGAPLTFTTVGFTGGVPQIGTGTNYSVNQIADLVNNPHGSISIPARPGEARITLADNTKAKDMLGWEPTKKLDDYFKNKKKFLWFE